MHEHCCGQQRFFQASLQVGMRFAHLSNCIRHQRSGACDSRRRPTAHLAAGRCTWQCLRPFWLSCLRPTLRICGVRSSPPSWTSSASTNQTRSAGVSSSGLVDCCGRKLRDQHLSNSAGLPAEAAAVFFWPVHQLSVFLFVEVALQLELRSSLFWKCPLTV